MSQSFHLSSSSPVESSPSDTWHMELLFPFLPLSHINSSSIHATDLTSSRSPCALYVADPGAQLWPHLGSWSWIANQRSCGRSWITMVDLDDGLWIMAASDCGGGSWSWWPADHRLLFSTRLLDIQYVYSYTLPLLTITPQLIYFPLFRKLFLLISVVNTVILLMFSGTRSIYCTSVCQGRGIPHMWLSLRFLRFFQQGFSFGGGGGVSLLLLRVKDRGCRTMRQIVICDYGLYK